MSLRFGMKTLPWLMAALCVVGLATNAGAVKPEADLLGLSDVIVVGTVVAAPRPVDTPAGAAAITIAVDRTLKGTPEPALTVLRVPGPPEAQDGTPRELRADDRELFFLQHDPRGYTLLGELPVEQADRIAAALAKPGYTLRIVTPLRPCDFGEPLQVRLAVKNLGDTPLQVTMPALEGVLYSTAMGERVVPFHVSQPSEMLARPADTVRLAPGEERELEFYVATDALASWQPLGTRSNLRTPVSVRAIALLTRQPALDAGHSALPPGWHAASPWVPLELGFPTMSREPTFTTSPPVTVQGLEFQAVANDVWPLPAPTSGSAPDVFLGLRVTNRTANPIVLNRFDTVSMTIMDADGKVLPMGGGRDATRFLPPFTLAPGETRTIQRDATIQALRDQHSWRIGGQDGTGGVWDCDLPRPGPYRVSFHYAYAEDGKTGRQLLRSTNCWQGEATTPAMTVQAVMQTQAGM